MMRLVLLATILGVGVGEADAQSSSGSGASTGSAREGYAPSLAERAARRSAFRDVKAVGAIREGIRWLRAHQDASGRWSATKFAAHDPADDKSTGEGNGGYDAGLTALSLLALLAQDDPELVEPCAKAADWLCKQLDPKTGCVPNSTLGYIYCQALTATALSEASALLGSERHRKGAEAAFAYLERHRNPGKGWRYAPQDGQSDTSVTAWCLAAYAAGRDAGVPCSAVGAGEALAWLDVVTSATSGHCGYTLRSEPSARTDAKHLEVFPVDETGLAGAALHARLVHGLLPSAPLAEAAHSLLSKWPPAVERSRRDFYLWCHISMATGIRGACGAPSLWDTSLRSTLVSLQSTKGSAAGSWTPDDCWGEQTGRVGATALNVLALSAPYRLGRQDLMAQLPKSASFGSVATLCRTQKYAAASKAVSELKASASTPPELAHCTRIGWMLDAERARAESALKVLRAEMNSSAAVLTELETIATRWNGDPFGVASRTELDQLRRDPKMKLEVAALDEFVKLRTESANLSQTGTKAQLQNIANRLQKFAAKNQGCAAADKARDLEAHLRTEALTRK